MILDGQKIVTDAEYDWQVTREINGSNEVFSLYLDGSGYVYYECGKYVYIVTADYTDVDAICSILESIGDKK